MKLKFGPVNAATVTPLLPDGSLDRVSVPKLVERWVQLKLDGAMVLGTMGEGRFLSNADRDAMVELSVAAAKNRLIVFATVADNSRALMVERAKLYARLGAHCCVICLPPGRPAPKAIADVKAIAEACPVPCAYYDIPANTGTPLVLEQMLDILKHPNIVVLKDSSGNDLISQVLPAHKPDGVTIFHGTEYRIAHSHMLGYDGCLHGGGTLTGKHVRQIWDAVTAGKIDQALKMDRENSMCLGKIYNRFSQPLQNILGQKYALQLLGALDHAADVDGTQLDEPSKQRVKQAVDEYRSWLAV